MNPLGILLSVVLVVAASSVDCSRFFRVANLPDRDMIDRITQIEAEYLVRDEKILQPSETLERLKTILQLLKGYRALTKDDELKRRAKMVKQLIKQSLVPDDSCDEGDIYEQAILGGMLYKAPNLAAYLKFHTSIRIGHCATVELGKAKLAVPPDTWTQLQHLMSYVYRKNVSPDVPALVTVVKGVVEYMQQKKVLPSTGLTKERFEEQFEATIEPICMSFNRELGPAVGIFDHYTRSDLGDRMSKRDIVLMNYYGVCVRVLACRGQAWEVFNSSPQPTVAVKSGTLAQESPEHAAESPGPPAEVKPLEPTVVDSPEHKQVSSQLQSSLPGLKNPRAFWNWKWKIEIVDK